MTNYEPPAGIELDLGNLVAFDQRVGVEDLPIQRDTQATEALVRAIFSLPFQSTDDGKVVQLPNPFYILPREKPIPKERPLTKWEQFSKEKGIQKKRRDRLVLDDATGEYVPRYGRGSKNSLDRQVIIPHKEGMSDDVDPFAEKKKEKKKRVKDNKKKNVSNIRRAQKKSGMHFEPMQALDVAKTGPSGKKFMPKKGLKDSLSVAQRSTASAGRFDEKVSKEPKQKLKGRKKKFETVTRKNGLGVEKERSQKIADRILMQSR